MAASLSRLLSGLRLSPTTASIKLLLSQNATSQLKSFPRCLSTALSKSPYIHDCSKITTRARFSSLQGWHPYTFNSKDVSISRLLLEPTIPTIAVQRTKTKFSKCGGKPKTVKAVVKRFYRLSWGIWIRPRSARKKRQWAKNKGRKFRLQQHVFCNSQQSRLLDKMVTRFWTRKKYYADDPYEPYERRVNFPEVPEKAKPFYP